jgi:HD-like signal output (HDOD) protein
MPVAPIDVHALIRNTPFLPPAFELVPRLLVLLDDPYANADDLAEVIRIDPGLTVDLLRIANSAYLAAASEPNPWLKRFFASEPARSTAQF